MEIDVKELLKVATEAAKVHFREVPGRGGADRGCEEAPLGGSALRLATKRRSTPSASTRHGGRRSAGSFKNRNATWSAIPSKKRASRRHLRAGSLHRDGACFSMGTTPRKRPSSGSTSWSGLRTFGP